MKQSKRRRLALQLNLTVLVATLAVSFSHLAGGIVIATGLPEWEGYALAFAIDMSILAAEYAALVDLPTRYTRTSLLLGLSLSALFNCLAFTRLADGVLHQAIGLALGIMVPVSLYILAQTSHRLSRVRPSVKGRKAVVSKLRVIR